MTNMPEASALEPQIRELLATIAGTTPSVDENLFRSGLLDSLKVVNLILRLEDTFKLPLSDGELSFDNLQSVRSIARWICELRPVEQG